MKAAICALVPIGLLAGALVLHGAPVSGPRDGVRFDPDCGGPAWSWPIAHTGWRCAPPYTTPLYTKPPDDSVALSSLLEAAGYTSAANTDWLSVAAGNFCGGPEKQLVLTQNQAPNFSILLGPTPHLRDL